jgi:hypothetical protein
MSVDFTPLLLNSARYIVLFQNFVVLWKIHMSQFIILPADASCQDSSNGLRVAYVYLRHVNAATGLKMKLKLLKTPKK